MSVLHLACASGHAYLEHCATMLHSALANRGDLRVHVHYLHRPGLPARSADLLRGMVEENGGELHLVAVPDERIRGLPVTQHFNLAMWYRIDLPDLLPELDRVLYLDADTIVLDSLEPLWRTDVTEHYTAAVTNVFGPWDADYPERLGLADPRRYFNTGVQLMNLDALRRDGCVRAVREYAVANMEKLWWCEQDAMNVVVGERRLPLYPRWNCMNSLLAFDASDELFGAEAAEEARRRPGIRHFEGGGANKPWHYLCDQEGREAYFEHRRATPWPELHLEGVTARNVGRRLVRSLRSRVG